MGRLERFILGLCPEYLRLSAEVILLRAEVETQKAKVELAEFRLSQALNVTGPPEQKKPAPRITRTWAEFQAVVAELQEKER